MIVMASNARLFRTNIMVTRPRAATTLIFVVMDYCDEKCRGFAKKIDGNVCMEQSCKIIGGTTDDILKGLAHFTGKQHVNQSTGPLSPAELDAVLSKGNPVIISVA